MGTACLQQKHVYLGTQGIQSVGRSSLYGLAAFSSLGPSVRPGPSGISQQHPPFRQTIFSGRDLGTFWPGMGRDEPPCRIQSVIWYLVLHTHPRSPGYYIVHTGSGVPTHTHTHTYTLGVAGKRDF